MKTLLSIGRKVAEAGKMGRKQSLWVAEARALKYMYEYDTHVSEFSYIYHQP